MLRTIRSDGVPSCAAPHKEGCLAEESCPQSNRIPALSAWLAGRKIVALLSLNWFMIPPMLQAVSYRSSSPGPRSIVLRRTTSRPLAVWLVTFIDVDRLRNVVCDLLHALRALTRRRPTEPSDLSPIASSLTLAYQHGGKPQLNPYTNTGLLELETSSVLKGRS
jgi:hypothetical protein